MSTGDSPVVTQWLLDTSAVVALEPVASEPRCSEPTIAAVTLARLARVLNTPPRPGLGRSLGFTTVGEPRTSFGTVGSSAR